MDALPTAIVNWVGAFLPLQDVCSLALTCKRNHFCMLPHLRVAFAQQRLLPFWERYNGRRLFDASALDKNYFRLYNEDFSLYGEVLLTFLQHPEIKILFETNGRQVSLSVDGVHLMKEGKVASAPEEVRPVHKDELCTEVFTLSFDHDASRNRQRRKSKREADAAPSPSFQKKQRLHIQDLPKPMIVPEIFKRLEPLDLASVSLVCKQWNGYSEAHWRTEFINRWKFSFMSRNLPYTTPMVLTDGFSSWRHAYHSRKTRLYFGQNNGQPEILVHQKPLNQSWGQ